MGNKIYVLNTKYNFEREKWYEAMLNCRRTYKEINKSISLKPKNIQFLVNILNGEGENGINQIAEKKKDNILKIFPEM